MNNSHRRHLDIAHHHPVVRKSRGVWTWSCECGSARCRTDSRQLTWHQIMVEALMHSTTIAA